MSTTTTSGLPSLMRFHALPPSACSRATSQPASLSTDARWMASSSSHDTTKADRLMPPSLGCSAAGPLGPRSPPARSWRHYSPAMASFSGTQDFKGRIGEHLGYSDWLEITQER